MTCRGIRGAICVDENEARDIVQATQTLLGNMMEVNSVRTEDVASVQFTATPDLNAAYPARGAREMGWTHIPLMCAQEMSVKGSLTRCIRVLLMWNTELSQDQVQHVYLGKARQLRPDWAQQVAGEEEEEI